MKEIENKFSKKVNRLCSVRWTEYESSLLNEIYIQHGIMHETIVSYSPEINGKAKRKK